jgi:hypothetical protein
VNRNDEGFGYEGLWSWSWSWSLREVFCKELGKNREEKEG